MSGGQFFSQNHIQEPVPIRRNRDLRHVALPLGPESRRRGLHNERRRANRPHRKPNRAVLWQAGYLQFTQEHPLLTVASQPNRLVDLNPPRNETKLPANAETVRESLIAQQDSV